MVKTTALKAVDGVLNVTYKGFKTLVLWTVVIATTAAIATVSIIALGYTVLH